MSSKASLSSMCLKAVGITLAFDLPCELARWCVKASWQLPEQSVTAVFDLSLGLILLPIVYGSMILMCEAQSKGNQAPLKTTVMQSLKYWGPLLVANLSLGIIMLGWALIGALPGLGVNYLLKIPSPYALIPYAAVGAAYGMVPLTYTQVLVVAESLSPWEARRRSRVLAKGQGRLLVAFFLGMVLLPEMLAFGVEFFAEQAADWARSLAQLGTGSLALEPGSQADPLGIWTTPEVWGVALRLVLGVWGALSVVMACHLYHQRRSQT